MERKTKKKKKRKTPESALKFYLLMPSI